MGCPDSGLIRVLDAGTVVVDVVVGGVDLSEVCGIVGVVLGGGEYCFPRWWWWMIY